MKYSIVPALLLLSSCIQFSNAGFINAPFPYFVNPGAPITSAASPFIHGFGSPLVSPFVNFYHAQPILKTFYQPVFYHQAPQFFQLPAPQFYALPQETTAKASESSGGYPSAPDTNEAKSGATGSSYGPPGLSAAAPLGPDSQFQSSPSGYSPDRDNNRFSGPSGSSSSAIEVFEDDFRGDKESVIVDSDKARNPQRPNDNFQSFIANSGENSRRNTDQSQYAYRDNSVRDGQGRPEVNHGRTESKQQGYPNF